MRTFIATLIVLLVSVTQLAAQISYVVQKQNERVKRETNNFTFNFVTQDGRCGVESVDGQVILPCQYNIISFCEYTSLTEHVGYFIVHSYSKKAHKVGVYSVYGEVIIEPKAEYSLILSLYDLYYGPYFVVKYLNKKSVFFDGIGGRFFEYKTKDIILMQSNDYGIWFEVVGGKRQKKMGVDGKPLKLKDYDLSAYVIKPSIANPLNDNKLQTAQFFQLGDRVLTNVVKTRPANTVDQMLGMVEKDKTMHNNHLEQESLAMILEATNSGIVTPEMVEEEPKEKSNQVRLGDIFTEEEIAELNRYMKALPSEAQQKNDKGEYDSWTVSVSDDGTIQTYKRDASVERKPDEKSMIESCEPISINIKHKPKEIMEESVSTAISTTHRVEINEVKKSSELYLRMKEPLKAYDQIKKFYDRNKTDIADDDLVKLALVVKKIQNIANSESMSAGIIMDLNKVMQCTAVSMSANNLYIELLFTAAIQGNEEANFYINQEIAIANSYRQFQNSLPQQQRANSIYSPHKEVCSLCKGKGWINGSKAVNYGYNTSHYCEESKKNVGPNHSHEKCPSCGGTGYIEKAFSR